MCKENHPFLDKNFPPNWKAMSPEFLTQDISLALKNSKKNLDKIKSLKNGLLSYEDCILALDNATNDLDLAWGYAMHLSSVNDSQLLRDGINENVARVTNFYSGIVLDEKLWSVINAYSKTSDAQKLKANQKILFKETLNDFLRHGANLPKKQKVELKLLHKKLALLTKKFSENSLDAINEFSINIKNKSELTGLPQSALALGEKNAKDKKLSGYVYNLQQPSLVAILTYAKNENLRKTLWEESVYAATKGKFSNKKLIPQILDLRNKIAKLLGKNSFADYILEERMAKTGKNALSFIEKIHSKVSTYFKKECEELKAFANDFENEKKILEPYSIAYYADNLCKKLFDFDSEILRPYFDFEKSLKGLFTLSEKLFSLKISKAKNKEKNCWADGVDYYEIKDKSGKLISGFYTDFVPRKSKRSGAWMNILMQDANSPTLCFIGGNLTPATKDMPALLSHDELCTLFHEFGHLLHFSMMSMPEISLRDVAWDFVELPSQLLENWCWEKECLDTFAKHYKTKQKIPNDVFKKLLQTRKFRGASDCMRQLCLAKSDLELHINTKKYLKCDIDKSFEKLLKNYKMEFAKKYPSHLYKFTHIFGDEVGYAAGYYSYKWAEVLDACAFSKFKKEGIFNSKTGALFAEKILKVGKTISPEKAFKNFFGGNSNIDSLLERTI